MSKKFVPDSRNSIETNVRFERFGSTCRQIGIILAFFVIFGARQGAFAAEKTSDQVVFFSAPVAVQTETYSSPSPQAYVTGAISAGEYVEIFFRLPQGYCAIKPPKGSFSWVNGKFLRAAGETDGQIEVSSGKKAPARIGGDSPEVSSVVQVGLQNRQRVKIIGKKELADGSVWYKIAPPPGEFRWIKTSDLEPDPALDKIPEKLTFQSEFLANRQTSDVKNGGQGASDSDEFNLSENAGVSTQDFKREVASLNAETFQALQKNPKSQEELNLLATRAEELFDAAPDDDDRFFIQSIYEIIKKTQASESKKNANNPFIQDSGYYGENAFQSSAVPAAEGARYGGVSFQTAPNSFGQFDASSFAQTDRFGNAQFVGSPFVDSSNSGVPSSWNSPNAFAYSSTFNVPRTTNAAGSNGAKNAPGRMEFAFSGGNTPFKSKKREAKIVYGSSKPTSRASSNLSRLPSLFSPAPQEIVPPSSYNNAYGIGLSQIRQNSRLIAEAQKKKNEETALAQGTKPTKTEQNRSSEVAQTTPKGTTDDATNKTSVASETPESNGINVAGLTSKNGSGNAGKIRQTSAFTPVASPTNQGYNAVGTLTVLSDASEGSPRYALSSPSYAGGVVYLVPAEGVSLAPYVGQNVGVKGTSGAVVVGSRSRKMVVVGSIFPL